MCWIMLAAEQVEKTRQTTGFRIMASRCPTGN